MLGEGSPERLGGLLGVVVGDLALNVVRDVRGTDPASDAFDVTVSLPMVHTGSETSRDGQGRKGSPKFAGRQQLVFINLQHGTIEGGRPAEHYHETNSRACGCSGLCVARAGY